MLHAHHVVLVEHDCHVSSLPAVPPRLCQRVGVVAASRHEVGLCRLCIELGDAVSLLLQLMLWAGHFCQPPHLSMRLGLSHHLHTDTVEDVLRNGGRTHCI